MLIDDNMDDNFVHERIIKKNNCAEIVVIKQTGRDALEHLKNKPRHEQEHPDIIFLDINMPGMNGWEFLEEYQKLDKGLQSRIVVVMLTTSENPDDKIKTESLPMASHFRTKPLTKDMLLGILNDALKNATSEGLPS